MKYVVWPSRSAIALASPLLERIFDPGMEQWAHCDGKLIAAVDEPAATNRIFTHLGVIARVGARQPRISSDANGLLLTIVECLAMSNAPIAQSA